jgi:uncharacterized protein (TIGR02594 family)
MSNYSWMTLALSYLGTAEIKGKKHNPKIQKWLRLIKAPFNDDETPWCATFVCGIFEEVGIRSWRSAWARGGLAWGRRLFGPAVGCVVVFERGPKAGHVGFLVGQDQRGNLMILGGNQGDKVSIRPFPKSRVLGYVWPTEVPLPVDGKLPVVASNGKLSTNEA